MKIRLLGAAAAAALAFAAPAYAAVTISYVGSDNPDVLTEASNGPAKSTVHYVADGAYADNTVLGTVGANNLQVIITGDEVNGIKPSNTGTPQAWIVSTDGSGLSFLNYALAGGATFTAIEFNAKVFPGDGNQIWAMDVYSYNGALLEHAVLSGLNNNNFISVSTTNGERLSNVQFTTSANLQGVGQLRISGGDVAVPEPASWALMLMGFGGMGALLRRNRQHIRMALA